MSSAESHPMPIFPLPSVQMFPGALLPLHVFEPRYRALVRDAAGGARRIAMPELVPGYEADYEGRPPVRAICGVGELIAHEPMPDGRSNILLRGIGRIRITDELPPDKPYRIVHSVPLADLFPRNFDDQGAREALLALIDRLALGLPTGGDTLRQLAREPQTAGALTDVLAATVVAISSDRQQLLETVEVERRVDLLTGHLAALIAGRVNGGSRPLN
jgi:uncharacterized protein